MRQLFRELKRRNVYKVAVAYVTVAFVGFQGAKLLIPSTVLPAWTDEFFLFLLIIGFPVALVVAWAFEMTPEGVRRTADAEGASETESMPPEERRTQSRLAMKALAGLGLVGAAVAGGWYLLGGGGEPSTETAAAMDTAQTEPEAGERSIAVLPFEALGQAEPDAFTEGMHDDLLARLSNVSDLKVISRTSVQQYRDTRKTTGEIARELGVRWVLEGGVQEMGDEIQVNAQLIDPRTDTHAWADSYRRDLTAASLFDLQSEITRSIATSLEAELTPDETERIERQPTEDLDAYRLYVQGRQQFARRSRSCLSCLEEAVKLFRQAIEQDSSFALAWTGLADAVGHRWWDYVGHDTLRVTPAEAARRALELDSDLAEAHASMGHVHLRNMDAPAARQELQRAIDLKPSYWEAHHWLGGLYLKTGRAEQALDHLELAVELNPQHAWARHWLYDAYLAAGQAEKSLREARRQQVMGLEGEAAVGGEVRALLKLGRLKEARKTLRQHRVELEQAGESLDSYSHAQLGILEAAAGDTVRARELLDQLPDAYDRALLHAALGDIDAFFKWSDQLEQGDFSTLGVSVNIRTGADISLEVIKDDPRYRELIRRANRAWGLNPDGSFPSEADGERDE